MRFTSEKFQRVLTDFPKAVVFAIAVQEVDPISRRQVIDLLLDNTDDNPLHEYLRNCTTYGRGLLDSFINITIYIAINNYTRDLHHHRQLMSRDKLYQALLVKNAADGLIRILFPTKSQQHIALDRKALRVTSIRGRPRAIGGSDAYDVAARWSTLTETIPSLIERLLELSEDFPQFNVNSLYNLVHEL